MSAGKRTQYLDDGTCTAQKKTSFKLIISSVNITKSVVTYKRIL